MSCLAEEADPAMEEMSLAASGPRACERLEGFFAASLFDLPVEPVGRFDGRPRREEDSERWDGLS